MANIKSKTQIIEILRATADKIERDEALSPDDVVAVTNAANYSNNFHLEQLSQRSNVLTRKAWDSLPHDEQTKFLSSGGKLVDA